MSVEVRSSEVY